MLLYSFTKVGRGKGFKSQLWLFSFTEEYFQVILKKQKLGRKLNSRLTFYRRARGCRGGLDNYRMGS